MAKSPDLFDAAPGPSKGYTAKDIEVLEGLEPVRRRPGMYIGGTDERALHHLAAEIIDNAMDEAVAGHASRIEIDLEPGDILATGTNHRGLSSFMDGDVVTLETQGLGKLTFNVRDPLKRTWLRETRQDRKEKGQDGPTPQVSGKYAPNG